MSGESPTTSQSVSPQSMSPGGSSLVNTTSFAANPIAMDPPFAATQRPSSGSASPGLPPQSPQSPQSSPQVTSLPAGGGGRRQRGSAVRYSSLQKATDSPILAKANKVVNFDESFYDELLERQGLPMDLGTVGEMQGWRKTMEDASVLKVAARVGHSDPRSPLDSPPRSNPASRRASIAPSHASDDMDSLTPFRAVLAVCDGHRGKTAAKMSAERLVPALQDRSDAIIAALQASNNGALEEACTEACWDIDGQLRASSSPIGDGTTCSACLAIDDDLVLMNVGDSRSYVVHCDGSRISADHMRQLHLLSPRPEEGPDAPEETAEEKEAAALRSMLEGVEVIATSRDQKASREDETARIQAAGGFVVNGRVNGKLGVSRAFGDFDMKPMPAEPTPRPAFPVTCTPEVQTQKVRHTNLFDYTLVLVGCDGVWERLTAAKIADKIVPLVDDYLTGRNVSAAIRSRAASIDPTTSTLAAFSNVSLESSAAASDQPAGQQPHSSPNFMGSQSPGSLHLHAGQGSSGSNVPPTPGANTMVRMRHAIRDLLDQGCSPYCDQTGGALGMDNMTLGVLLLVNEVQMAAVAEKGEAEGAPPSPQ